LKLRYKATDGDEDHLLVVPVRAGAESRSKKNPRTSLPSWQSPPNEASKIFPRREYLLADQSPDEAKRRLRNVSAELLYTFRKARRLDEAGLRKRLTE
jgi:hypothetical protein